MAKNHQESRWILEALFLTSCDKIIQRRNSARTFGTCDDVVCEPLFGVMLVSGCSGTPTWDYLIIPIEHGFDVSMMKP